MKRRNFFKNLIGATAAIAIGPALMAQVEEHEYKSVPKVTQPLEKIFTKDQGLWVFRDEKLVAWSALDYCVIHFDPPSIDTTYSDDRLGPDMFKRPPEIDIEVDDLHLIDPTSFMTDEGKVKIVFALRDGKEGMIRKLASDAIWMELGFRASLEEHIKRSASFKCTGKADIEITTI